MLWQGYFTTHQVLPEETLLPLILIYQFVYSQAKYTVTPDSVGSIARIWQVLEFGNTFAQLIKVSVMPSSQLHDNGQD